MTLWNALLAVFFLLVLVIGLVRSFDTDRGM